MVAKLDTVPRVGEQAYQAIYAAIMNGQYPVGKRLQIRDLARDLGTSVMPVREALGRLEAVGLVETRPYRGAVVRALTRAELLDIYSVRRLLEVPAARLGVVNMGPEAAEAVAALRAELTRMEEGLAAGDTAAYLDADEAFLAIIYRAANSPVLFEHIQSLWNRCRHYKLIGVEHRVASGQSAELLGFQARLLEAVEAGDPDGAARATGESVDEATARIESGLYDRATKD